MTNSLSELTEEVLRLPAESRAKLAERLADSLDEVEVDDDIEKLWTAEAARRMEEMRSGRVVGIPGDQVLSEARKRVCRQP